MAKDYTVILKEELTILGHKAKAVCEKFNNEYLTDMRCLRCCFYKDYNICHYIKCTGKDKDVATHFELYNKDS